MPTLSQLHYIVTVDKMRHFGKAAKACHVSQPTLSMQIQKAEDELGVVLFDRDVSPVLATIEGEALIVQARTILSEYDKLMHLSRGQGADTLQGELRVGVIPTLAVTLLPLFQKSFTDSFPKIELIVEELKTEDLLQKLSDEQIDAGLLATPIDEGSGLYSTPLFSEDFYVYASEGHRYLEKERMTAEDLSLSEIFLMTEGHCFRDQLVALCSLAQNQKKFGNKKVNIPRKGGLPFQFEATNFETLRQLILKGQGYTLFPQLYIDLLPKEEVENHVRGFVDPIPKRDVILAQKRKQWKRAMVNALSETIRAREISHHI